MGTFIVDVAQPKEKPEKESHREMGTSEILTIQQKLYNKDFDVYAFESP